MFSYNLERAGGKFTVTPAGYILVNDKIDRETEDVHSFQVSRVQCSVALITRHEANWYFHGITCHERAFKKRKSLI